MEATYSEHISTPFVIRKTEIESLTRLLEKHVGTPTGRIKCADGIFRELPVVPDLLQYENSSSRAIIDLQLEAKSNDRSKEASIDFSSSKWRGVSLTFRADEDTIFTLRTGTLEIIDGARPWYGPIQAVNFVSIGVLAILVLWFAAMLTVAISKTSKSKLKTSKKLSNKDMAIGNLVAIGALATIFALCTALNMLRDALFPRAFFAIGQGVDRFQMLEKIHWGIIITTLLTMLHSFAILTWRIGRDRAKAILDESPPPN